MPEYRAVLLRFTSVMLCGGRRSGRIAQRLSRSAWLWPPPAEDAADAPSEAGGGTERHPLLSVIGSSNLSERSTNRDLELSMCIVTTDSCVRAQLHLEQARLREHARDATQAGAGVSGEGPLAAAVVRAVARALRTLF